jgi:hypothetical protein
MISLDFVSDFEHIIHVYPRESPEHLRNKKICLRRHNQRLILVVGEVSDVFHVLRLVTTLQVGSEASYYVVVPVVQ